MKRLPELYQMSRIRLYATHFPVLAFVWFVFFAPTKWPLGSLAIVLMVGSGRGGLWSAALSCGGLSSEIPTEFVRPLSMGRVESAVQAIMIEIARSNDL